MKRGGRVFEGEGQGRERKGRDERGGKFEKRRGK